MIITTKLRDAYIDDLLRARPQGPHGRRVSYTTSEEYNYDKGKYVMIPTPSDSQWGYTDEEIFSLGLHTMEDVQEYVLARWFKGSSKWSLGGRKATFTRRVNRLWEARIRGVVKNVKKTGGDGIYLVTIGEGYYSNTDDIGHIYASNMLEAQRFAEMFFSYLSAKANHKVKVYFVRFGSPEELVVLNSKIITQASEKIKAYHENIKKLEGLIERQGVYLETLQTVQDQQLNAES